MNRDRSWSKREVALLLFFWHSIGDARDDIPSKVDYICRPYQHYSAAASSRFESQIGKNSACVETWLQQRACSFPGS